MCAGVLSLSAAPADAAGPFVVDTAADGVDATVGDGVCATAGGACTLRAAVQEANAATGTITTVGFAPAVTDVLLTIPGPGGAEEGDLDVDAGVDLNLVGNVVVPGGGAPDRHTVVDASSLGDRILDVAAGASVSIELVTLAGGTAVGAGGAVRTAGDVLVRNGAGTTGSYTAMVRNSATTDGGAVAVLAGGSLTLKNASTAAASSRVDVTDNYAGEGGGAIANLGGAVTITGAPGTAGAADVYVDSNGAGLRGGAVWNAAGTLELGCRAYLRFSSAPVGGDLANDAAVVLAGAGIDAGRADEGGGIHNGPTGSIDVDAGCGSGVGTRVTRSTAAVSGGAIWNEGSLDVAAGAELSVSGDTGVFDAPVGGGLLVTDGTVTVDGRLLVEDADATLGGGIAVTGGTLTTVGDGLVDANDNRASDGGGVSVSGGVLSGRFVVAANSASGSGGNLSVSGGGVVLSRSAVLGGSAGVAGGIAVTGGSLAASNTTIAGNNAPSPGAAATVTGGTVLLRHATVAANSSGLAVAPPGAVTLQRVLMARNGGFNCITPAGVAAGDFNVFDDGTCGPTGTDFTDASRFDQVDARLDDDLADGDPYSFGLEAVHPAIDFVTDGGCGTPADDQLGAARPYGPACDAGAVEGEAAAATHPVSGTVRWEPTGEPLEGICVIALAPSGSDDPSWGRTGADGTYTAQVADGTHLVAFYEPVGATPGLAGCDDEPDPTSVQPEWFDNVAVTFDAGDGSPQLPDPASVTLVTVAGSAVTGIDACLGPGPGAGADGGCASPAASPGASPGTTPGAAPDGVGAEEESGGADGGGNAGVPLAFSG